MYHQLISTAAVMMAFVAVKGEKPWFCQTYDCPAFTSEDRVGYEARNYEQTNWVTTSISSSRPDPSRSESSGMFWKLFNYIRGENSLGLKIDMTVPVLTKVENLGTEYRITMMFYLTTPNPPNPNDSEVFLVRKPAGLVFVKSFPSWWWPSNKTYRTELAKMKIKIGNINLYDDTIYYKAGYNSPYDFFKRKQHEVWMDSL